MTEEEYENLMKNRLSKKQSSNSRLVTKQSSKKNKYNAKKTTVGDLVFDSRIEAKRYDELNILQAAGVITDLTLQPSWEIIPKQEGDGVTYRASRYTADFKYKECGKWVVEDVKSVVTAKKPDYILRKKLMLLNFGIVIKEYMK